MDSLKISNNEFITLLAVTAEEQEMGLKYKDWPPPVMSFIYASPRINKFWMKDTKSPLDILFCLNNKIINICSGVPYSTMVIGNDHPSDLVIELPAGTCDQFKIKAGDPVELTYSKDSLLKIFSMKSSLL